MNTTESMPVTLTSLPLIRRGSVKNLRGPILNPAHPDQSRIVFEFTNDFSVFDWGKMPDEIPGKGQALLGLGSHLFREISHPASWRQFFASDTAQNFMTWATERAGTAVLSNLRRELESIGMRSCFRGVYSFEGQDQGMIVENLPMIPLEVVFRHALTDRSSYFERYPETPLKPGHRFQTPLVEFFTKLEPIDRFLPTAEEACTIGKISPALLLELELRTSLLALWLGHECRVRELDLIDGKFEWGMDREGRIVLADAIGPDELRLVEMRKSLDGSAPARLSKEFLREYYRDSKWFAEVQDVKKRAGDEPLAPGWQKTVKAEVPLLPRDGLEKATALYEGLERRFRPANVLLVGSGGREHAIARKLCDSPNLRNLYWTPAQDAALTALRLQLDARNFPQAERKRVTRWEGTAFDVQNPSAEALAELKALGVNLVVLSQDADLAAGAADRYRQAGFSVFGPSREAARVEWSKAFMKDLCAASGTPTARSFTLRSPEETIAKLEQLEWNATNRWVVKSDGLAAGKGVVVAETREEAIRGVAELCRFGEHFIVEERLSGAESSWFAFSDGESFSLLDPARDYKRLGDGQTGPNTGGMGAISPAPGTTPELRERVRREIFAPLFGELKKRGIRYQGLLYAGLMIDSSLAPSRISLLELNARFGDPETQALLPRMRGDLLEWFFACAEGTLRQMPRDVPFADETTVFVVAAARGYPDRPELGAPVKLSDETLRSDEFRFAGLRAESGAGGGWTVGGGRVLGALGTGTDADHARKIAYRNLEPLLFTGAQIRKDIGL